MDHRNMSGTIFWSYLVDIFVLPIPVMHGWNHIMPQISSLRAITYWQSVVMLFVLHIIVSGGCAGFEMLKIKHEETLAELRGIRTRLDEIELST